VKFSLDNPYACNLRKDLLLTTGLYFGLVPYRVFGMLYTASVSSFKRTERKLKVYYIVEDHGNDPVVPDLVDICQFRTGVLTWEGFKVNYLAKLMRSDAVEWMRRISVEAVSEDVVLVDEEKEAEYSCRKLLAEMMMNMFSGHLKLHYMGELIN